MLLWLLLGLLSFEGPSVGYSKICMTWEATESELALLCKVEQLQFTVGFINPWQVDLGQCVPPFPAPQCYHNYENATLTQNLQTNSTELRVKGHIDNTLNGRWSCYHGFQLDVSNVNVTILKPASNNLSGSCNSVLIAIICLVSSIWGGVLTFVLIFKRKKLTTSKENLLKDNSALEDEDSNATDVAGDNISNISSTNTAFKVFAHVRKKNSMENTNKNNSISQEASD